MTEWLAVIVFCVNGECMFWASNKEPYASKAECEKTAMAVMDTMNKQGAETPMATCIPIKWIKA